MDGIGDHRPLLLLLLLLLILETTVQQQCRSLYLLYGYGPMTTTTKNTAVAARYAVYLFW